ncbi:MAG: hypothetical protein GOU97_01765 [Nanoarchaeota archaeon]|nr:hypothetical protein [Nanoarchaeota archaeon]
MISSKKSKIYSKKIVGKTVVSKTGKTFGKVGDLVFESRTGELISIVLKEPTKHASDLDLEKEKGGYFLIPFNAVMAVGDLVVVAEEDLI